MGILQGVTKLFAGRKRLNKIPLEDIRRERLRLEQTEQRIAHEVEELEARKRELFARGQDEASQRQQVMLARKIKELDSAARAKDRQLAMLSRQVRVLSGLAVLKENQAMMRNMGVSGIVSRLDLSSLEAFVEKATVEGQFQMERFGQLLEAMEGPEDTELAEEDEDTLAIVAAMQEARQAEEEAPGLAVAEGMKKVDERLHKKDAADREAP